MSDATATADKISAIAASIRLALSQAAYPPAAEQTVIAAARSIVAWGSLHGALGDQSNPSPSIIGREVDALLSRYRAALEEAGRPDLISARLLLWAEWADAAAERQEVTLADFAARLAIRRANAGWWMHTVEELERTVAAHQKLVDEHKAAAAEFRAQAQAVAAGAAPRKAA